MTSPPFVRPDVRMFLDYVNAMGAPESHVLGAAAARASMRGARDLADLPTGELALIRDIAIPRGDGGEIGLRLYDARAERPPSPILVFYHGGGFVLGDLDTHEPLCAEIARTLDLPVVAVDYRLAPEATWPAAPDDCEAAARWIAGNAHALGRAATGLVLAGDSAGGKLAIVTALALRDAPAETPLLALWAAYPAADMGKRHKSFDEFGQGHLLSRETLGWFLDAYAPDLTHWRAAPLRASLAGLPPTLVVTAGLDPLRDQGRAFAAALAQAGVPSVFREARGQIHGFLNLRRAIPSAQGDLAGDLAALRALIVEAEGEAVMRQAAGAPAA